jgi:hypothetical protein
VIDKFRSQYMPGLMFRRHSGTDPPAQKGPNPGAASYIKVVVSLLCQVLWMRDILLAVRSNIRIRSLLRILIFSSVAFKMPTKNNVFAFYFLKVHFHQSSTIKSHEEVTKQLKSRFFLLFFAS